MNANRRGSRRASVLRHPRCVLASVAALWGIFLISGDARAMSVDQMNALTGLALLELRVDVLFRQCGLPSVIIDAGGPAQPRQGIRWRDQDMQLSRKNWVISYSRRWEVKGARHGWTNPGAGGLACLADLSQLILHAKGDVGVLAVTKRADDQGYLTSYRIPGDLFAAHQVIGLTGTWKQGVPIAGLRQQYGKPDEILDDGTGIEHFRYWVVAKEKQMPVSVHAVDFEVKAGSDICSRYSVQTSGYEFVQEKYDALRRDWEKDYVLD